MCGYMLTPMEVLPGEFFLPQEVIEERYELGLELLSRAT
jgi:hypothetical protein